MERLSPLDSQLLSCEDASGLGAHVASVLVFDGPPPSIDALTGEVVARLHRVPRYRQKIVPIPLDLGRPARVDDPHFNPGYHVRHTALPRPGGEAALARLAGRLFSQRLDRTKPLWELWLVEGLAGDRFALIGKTHHVLVDGVDGLDLITVLFEQDGTRSPVWVPRPMPSRAELVAGAVLDRGVDPLGLLSWALHRPGALAGSLAGRLGLGGDEPPPRTRLNVRLGPHRRYAWVTADLERFRQIKTALGGTVNDVVLTVVAGAVGRYLRAEGDDTDGLVLSALVPVWTPGAGARGGGIELITAPLPVGLVDPRERFRAVSEALDGLRESGRAAPARALTELAGLAPSTIVAQAARLRAAAGRRASITVTNVPGPQAPLELLGRELRAIYPVVPLAERQALGVAVVSYRGQLGFGLLADYDAVPAVDRIARELEAAIDELGALAGARRAPRRARRADGRGRPARA